MKVLDHSYAVDGNWRMELGDLFAGCKAGLVFVTAFETRRANWQIANLEVRMWN